MRGYAPDSQERTGGRTADKDLLESSPSTGWRETCAIFGVSTDVEPSPDALAAVTRDDRSVRYNRKHLLGVST